MNTQVEMRQTGKSVTREVEGLGVFPGRLRVAKKLARHVSRAGLKMLHVQVRGAWCCPLNGAGDRAGTVKGLDQNLLVNLEG